jgi:hypothetical protein
MLTYLSLQTQNNPQLPVVLVVSIALISTIFANTFISMKFSGNHRWWYGLIKIAAYFGMFALTLSTGGLAVALASISTYLGMELSSLLRRLHQLGLLNGFLHASRSRRTDTEDQVAALD